MKKGRANKPGFFAALIGLLLLLGCQKADGPADDVFKTWEVMQFVTTGYAPSKSAESPPVYITLSTDQTYTLDLGVNTCSGTIETITDLGIIFSAPGCTKICCDNVFALRFAELLPYIGMYKITGETLRFYIKEWGFIECKRIGQP